MNFATGTGPKKSNGIFNFATGTGRTKTNGIFNFETTKTKHNTLLNLPKQKQNTKHKINKTIIIDDSLSSSNQCVNDITGGKLANAANQCVNDITAMKELFCVDGNDNMLVNPNMMNDIDDNEQENIENANDKILGEIIKIVQFALLHEKVQEELIPKFDLVIHLGE